MLLGYAARRRSGGFIIGGGLAAAFLLTSLWFSGCQFGVDHPPFDQRTEQLNKALPELPTTPASGPVEN